MLNFSPSSHSHSFNLVGGTLMLSDGSNILDNIIYPAHQSDVSYGRFTNGAAGSWQFMPATFNDNNGGVIDIQENHFSLNLNPNPATERLNINANQNMRQLRVMNGLGQWMETNIINRTNATIPVHQWPNCIYHISIEMQDGEWISRSFVKG